MHSKLIRRGLCGALLLAACSSSDGPVADPPAVDPFAAFASDQIFVVATELTAQSFHVLSHDTADGRLGLLPGSPADVGIRIGDVETLAADPNLRRVFFGSNVSGEVASVTLSASGSPEPAPGSPFAAQHVGISVVKASATGSSLYVGYQNESTLTRMAVAADGSLSVAQSVSAAPQSHVETMLRVEDVLYVGFKNGSRIVGYRLDGDAFVVLPDGTPEVVTDVAVNERPDYLVVSGTTLYASLADDGSVDAFSIEGDGALTRLAGAPYAFPGITQFELIAIQPGGNLLAVGAEKPTAAMALYTIETDGSLTPRGVPFILHERIGGPGGTIVFGRWSLPLRVRSRRRRGVRVRCVERSSRGRHASALPTHRPADRHLETQPGGDPGLTNASSRLSPNLVLGEFSLKIWRHGAAQSRHVRGFGWSEPFRTGSRWRSGEPRHSHSRL